MFLGILLIKVLIAMDSLDLFLLKEMSRWILCLEKLKI